MCPSIFICLNMSVYWAGNHSQFTHAWKWIPFLSGKYNSNLLKCLKQWVEVSHKEFKGSVPKSSRNPGRSLFLIEGGTAHDSLVLSGNLLCTVFPAFQTLIPRYQCSHTHWQLECQPNIWSYDSVIAVFYPRKHSRKPRWPSLSFI